MSNYRPEFMDGVRQKSLYFLGREKAGCFYQEEKAEIDYGCDYYAAQFFSSPEGVIMVNAWMNKWENEHKTQKEGWIGTMTTPRTFTFGQDGKIKGSYISSLEKLRKNEIRLQNVEPEAGSRYSFAEEKNSFWVEMDLAWEALQGNCFEIGLLTDRTGSGGLTICFEKDKNRLVVENHTVNHEGKRRILPVEPDFWSRPAKMEILVDVSCVEILIAEDIFITNCVYPVSDDSRFHYCRSDGEMRISQITLYDMDPAEFQFDMLPMSAENTFIG